MKYPIDTAQFIANAGLSQGSIEERFFRVFIPFVNDSYQAGREGREDYQVQAGDLIAYFEADGGHPLPEAHRECMRILACWINKAAAQGLKDRETESQRVRDILGRQYNHLLEEKEVAF